MVNSDELRALIAVGTAGSYHAAARATGLPRNTLRRRIGELEARVGKPLVQSTQSGVVLTALGAKVAHRSHAVLGEIDAMFAHLRMDGEEPVGQLRLGAPVGVPPQAFHPLISLLRARFPRVSIRQRFFENPANAADSGLDAYIDLSHLPALPGWVSHDLHSVDEMLLASRSYLDRRGAPATVEDLAGHELLTWLPPDREPGLWPRPDGGHIEVSPAFICSSIHVVHLMAAAGSGIALVPHSEVRLPHMPPSLIDLVPVLPDQVRGPRTLRLRMSQDVASLPAFRSLIEFSRQVAERFSPA